MIPSRKIDLVDYLLIAEEILGLRAEQIARVVKAASAESALAAPYAGFGDTEFYPEAPTKAAILCSRLVRNHPLPDGNKRAAYVCMREFLNRHGVHWVRPADDEVAETIEQLAAREITEEQFVLWVARHCESGGA